MAYTIYIAFDPNAAFPQTPLPGRNKGQDENENPIPPDGMALFDIQSDDPVLANGNRGDDIEQFYEVVEGPALRALSAAEVEAVRLPERKVARRAQLKEKARELAIERITAEVEAEIDADNIKTEEELRRSAKWRNPGQGSGS